MIRRHGEVMIENIPARPRTGQIEKAVIGEIDHARTIGPRRHVEHEFHRPGKAPGHLHVQRAGIALLAIGTGVGKRHGRMICILDRDNPPVAAIKTLQPAMQRVGPVIRRELHLSAVEREARAGDAVGIAPDGRTKELPSGEISLERLMTEHDVVATSGGIRHQQGLQRRAIGHDARFQSINRLQRNAFDFGAVGEHPEAGTHYARDGRRVHVASSKGSTVRRRPSRNASATSCSGARSTSASPVAASSRKRR